MIRLANHILCNYLLTRQPLPELSSLVLALAEALHVCCSVGPTMTCWPSMSAIGLQWSLSTRILGESPRRVELSACRYGFLTSHRKARGFWHLEICPRRASFRSSLFEQERQSQNIVPFDKSFWCFDGVEEISRLDQGLLWVSSFSITFLFPSGCDLFSTTWCAISMSLA